MKVRYVADSNPLALVDMVIEGTRGQIGEYERQGAPGKIWREFREVLPRILRDARDEYALTDLVLSVDRAHPRFRALCKLYWRLGWREVEVHPDRVWMRRRV